MNPNDVVRARVCLDGWMKGVGLIMSRESWNSCRNPMGGVDCFSFSPLSAPSNPSCPFRTIDKFVNHLYTTVFEEIIRSNKHGMYFGHLHIPDNCHDVRGEGEECALKSWEDDVEFGKMSHEQKRANVLGTLMKITDFRRMEDGKLLLLVQALDRFVVLDTVREVPYGIAHVQLLPDREEIQLPRLSVPAGASDAGQDNNGGGEKVANDSSKNNLTAMYTEDLVQPARAAAVMDAWNQWYPYEFETTQLPLPREENMDPSEVVGAAIAKVLPYAPFDTSRLPTELLKPPNMQQKMIGSRSSLLQAVVANKQSRMEQQTQFPHDEPEDTEERVDWMAQRLSGEKALEVNLLEGGILSEVQLPDSILRQSISELEINLWLALNKYLVESRTPVSPVLLGLLPQGQRWPADFLLERIADTIDSNQGYEHKYVRVSTLYPALRRQKRLSYCAPRLLERDQDAVNGLRQQLLQIPR
jgi:hypothetical protein